MPFIELPIISEDSDTTVQLINVDCIGRVYPNPQSTRKCIVELNYQSINDAPVFLEIEMAYEEVKGMLQNA